MGILLGAGVDAGVGPVFISVGGRYTIGTRTLDADPDPIDIKSRVWSLTASVGVRIVGS